MESSLYNILPLFFRAFGLLVILPLGEGIFEPMKRAFYALGLALIFFQFDVSSGVSGELYFVTEFLIGLSLALPLRLVIESASMWGELFDTGRGQNIGAAYDPFLNQSTSSIGLVLGKLTWVHLLYLGILEEIVLAYGKSLSLLTPGQSFFSLSWFTFGTKLLLMVTTMLNGLILFFLPLAIFYFLVDFSMGIIGKAVPQIHLYSEAFQLKSYLAILSLIALYRLDLYPAAFQLALPMLKWF